MRTIPQAVAIGLLLGSVLLSAQESGSHADHENSGSVVVDGNQQNEGMMDKCRVMHQKMDQMNASLSAGQTRVDALIQAIDTTTGSAKVDVLAATVKELAAQLEEMNAIHAESMHKMMQHMSEHMAMMADRTKTESAKSDMMKCPMMSGHGATENHEQHAAESREDKSDKTPEVAGAEDHSAHHSN